MPITSKRSDNAGQGIQKGSPFSILQEIDGTGTPSGDPISLGWIKTSDIADETSETESEAENGFVFKDQGARSLSFNVTFMQLDKYHKELGQNLKGKRFIYVKEEHDVPIDGKYQYRIFPNVSVGLSSSKDSKSDEVPYTLNAVINSSDVGVDVSALNDEDFQKDLSGEGVFTVPAGYGSAILEVDA